MNEHKLYQRFIAMTVSVFMVLGMLPVSVFAETYLEKMGGEIVAFEVLPEETASQEVALGTSLDDLDLPSSLTATVRLTAADVQDSGEDVQDSGARDSGEAPEESTELTIPVPVTWNPEPDYDGDTAGTYVFTADTGELWADTELPEITVTVQASGMMTASPVLRSGATVDKSYETTVGTTLEMDINDLTNIADILYPYQSYYYVGYSEPTDGTNTAHLNYCYEEVWHEVDYEGENIDPSYIYDSNDDVIRFTADNAGIYTFKVYMYNDDYGNYETGHYDPRTIKVTVTGDNTAPTLTSISTLTGGVVNTAYTVTYAALADAADEADADGDDISFRVEAVSSGSLKQGDTDVTEGETLLTSTSDALVWTPETDASGDLSAFTVKAYDGTDASETAIQVKINVAEAINADISKGSVNVSSSGIAYTDADGNAHTDAYSSDIQIVITGTTTENTVTVDDVTANITLSDADIELSSDSAMKLKDSAIVDLTLDNDNVFISSKWGKSALAVPENATLVIDGSGTLTADATGNGAAGIGVGPNYQVCGTVTINGGTITAIGDGAGIGGGYNGSQGGTVTITGGTVTATGNSGYGIGCLSFNSTQGTCYISGGSINATVGAIPQVSASDSTTVYLTTITLRGITSATAVSVLTITYNGTAYVYSIDSMATDDSGKLYLWLPADAVITAVTIGDTTYTGNIKTTDTGTAAGKLSVFEAAVDSLTADIGKGSVSVSSESIDYTDSDSNDHCVIYSADTEITVIGTTTSNTITVDGVTADITLSDVDIDVSGNDDDNPSALKLENANACVALTLTGSNTMMGAQYGPGLFVPDNTSVTIGGDGSLTATGGMGGAGIGGMVENAGAVTINSGTITATGGDYGAGIGGGVGNSGSVTINGGKVTAVGGSGSAGIGGGGGFNPYITAGGNGGTITITGGVVKATGNGGAPDIGGGNGPETSGDNGTCYISGGSMNVTTGTAPKISDSDSTPVYLTTVTLRDITAATVLGTLTISYNSNSYTYGTNDVTTDGSGKLYLWLPADAVVTAATVGDANYTGSVTTTDEGTAAGTLSVKEAAIDSLIADIGKGSVSVSAGSIDYTDADGNTHAVTYSSSTKITVIGTTTGNTVTVDDVTADITLSGTDIEVSSGSAFALKNSATVNLTLQGSNTLSSGRYHGGLEVPDGASITIGGDGSLAVTGGDGCAGIGSSDRKPSGNITINNGTITTTGGEEGAGIGSGMPGYDGGITVINGGTITAIGTDGGSGIGGGGGGNGNNGGSGGAVTITGGTITATGGDEGGAGIGGGKGAPNGGAGGSITISGGTVTATGNGGGAGIGGAYGGGFYDGVGVGGAGGTVTITGGVVNASGSDGAENIGGGVGAATNGDNGICYISGGSISVTTGAAPQISDSDSTPVYLTTVTLDGITTATAFGTLTISYNSNSYTYGTNDVTTDSSGKLYLWLPADAVVTAATVGDANYTGSVTTTDEGTAAGTLFAREASADNLTADISQGSVSVSTDSIDYTDADGNDHSVTYSSSTEITVTGMTASNTITVDDVTANITLSGADIEVSSGNAMTLTDSATVNLTLENDNVLSTSAWGYNSLNVPENATLVIDGSGTLTADIAGNASAAIGVGPNGHICGTVTINGGIVSATGDSAGIGGGYNRSQSGIVTITGGTVTATANSSNGKGIGCSDSDISYQGTCFISGGSINATIGATPQISVSDSTPVYLTTVTLRGITAATAVDALTITYNSSSYAYGTDNMVTDSSGKLYLWLPAGADVTGATAAHTAYSGSVAATAEGASGRLTDASHVVWDGNADTDWYNDNDTSFTLSNVSQVAGLAELVNAGNDFSGKTITLGDDIAINDIYDINDWTTSAPDNSWTAIGTEDDPFKGTFDGNDHMVKGIYIDSALNNQGLFGYISDATIKNIGVTDGYISACEYVGGIVGYNYFSTIENCYNTAAVNGTQTYGSIVGGIVGASEFAKLQGCYNSGTLTSTGTIGGIAGNSQNYSSIQNCYNTGSMTSQNANVGGIVGVLSRSLVKNCCNTGDAYTQSHACGGIAGSSSYSVLKCCYSTGSIAGSTYSSQFGSVVGISREKDSIISCYYNSDNCTLGGIEDDDVTGQAEGKTTDEMKVATPYDNYWNTGSWTFAAGIYPHLNLAAYDDSDSEVDTVTADIFQGGVAVSLASIRYTDQNGVTKIAAYSPNTQIVVTGTTTENNILVDDVTASITLSNANIDVSDNNNTALRLKNDDAQVDLTLTGSNTLKSDEDYAGLMVPEDTLVTIGGDGSLTVTGGLGGAGIGSSEDDAGNVTINSGTITATGGDYSAGIGGGVGNSGSVTINGGKVTAIGGLGSAGIGGGSNPYESAGGEGGSIIITGGVVKATGNDGAPDIGGGNGTETSSDAGTCYISGGTINAAVGATPQISGSDNTTVYLTTITLNGVDIVTAVSAMTVSYNSATYQYGINDITTDGSGKLYLWLPAGAEVTGATAAQIAYSGSVAATSEGASGTLYVPTASKMLTSITAPAVITGVANGTAKTAAALGLPTTVTLVTDDGNVSADVTWDVSESAYDASSTSAQTFTVSGTVTLPAGVANPDNVSLTTSISVSVTADTSSGDSSSDDSSSDSTFYYSGDTSDQDLPNMPVTAQVSIAGDSTFGGAAVAAVSDSVITNAIAQARAEAAAQGSSVRSVAVELTATAPQGATPLSATISHSGLTTLTNSGVTDFHIQGLPVSVSFDHPAIQAIQSQSSGNVTVSAVSVQDLSEGARNLIGSRPIFDITVGYGTGATISSLNGGIARIYIPYTPSENENTAYLYGVYVDNNGNAHRISDSIYNANLQCLIVSSPHLSTYGVGYSAPKNQFTDTTNHWAKEFIDSVVGRGLLSGTTATVFSPNKAVTRGTLAAALGKLANVDTNLYKTRSFTDVAADKDYSPYVQWAYEKGIMPSAGSRQFAPDKSITREEMAVILKNYAKATGYTLPVTREAITYADASSIGSDYKEAVKAMQQAGIMMGGTSNKFYPKSITTRAEGAAMLTRYVKLTIDPTTAQGWAKNDAGQWLYYKDGKALTGTQTIDGIKYSFYSTGALQTGGVQR